MEVAMGAERWAAGKGAASRCGKGGRDGSEERRGEHPGNRWL